jgi:PAS domain S-box-containing protein
MRSVRISSLSLPGARVLSSGALSRWGGRILILAGIYVIVGRLGLAIAPVHHFASLVWAPTGIALGTLLVGGPQLWPGVALGAFVVNAWIGAPVPVALGITAGNTLEAVAGAHLIRRAGGGAWSLERVGDVIAFIALGALLSTVISATVGVSSLFAGGLVPLGEVAETWRVWWLGDAVGALVVGSMVLAWTGPRPQSSAARARRAVPARLRMEAAALGASVIAATVFVFFHPPFAASTGFVLACMLIPLLIWGALRFDMRGATAAVFLASALAVAGTAFGRGPFAQESVSASLLHLQSFMAIVAAAVLIVGAVTVERAGALRRCEREEQAVRESQDELRLITDATPLMLTRCSRDLRYRFVNRAYARMLGRTPEEIHGTPIVELVGARGYETIRPHVETVLQGRRVEYEDEVHFEGIGTRTLHVVYVPDRNARGEVVGWVASIIDVTERKRAEAEARSLARLRGMFDNAATGIVELDSDDRYAAVNDHLCKLLGHTREELLGASVHDLTAPEDHALSIERFAQLHGRREDLLEYDKRYLRRGGEALWVHEKVSARRNGSNQYVGAIATIEDISARKAAEFERDRLLEALRDADRRKNDFLGMLSHELRNPLAPIRNSLYVLGRAAPGGEQARRALAVIDRQVQHTTRLVDDLLDVTRITSGKIRLQRERVDLGELARRTAEDHRAAFAKNGVRLEVTVAAEPVIVNVDAVRIAQVIGNLLQNAVKFTPSGGSTTLAIDRSDGFGIVTVRDTGAGIQPDVLSRLFEPFVQAETTLDRTTGGLGLGLALVKGLAELHGGSVSAHSEGVGRGAAFTVRLPVESRKAPRLTAVPARLAPGPARRVLVIEDNVDAAETLKQALELNDHLVDIALTGSEGLEKMRSFKPDVVLCDIGLPGMDGFQVTRTIRADPRASGIALIALSGYAQAEDVERSRDAGFDLHLAKPPEPDALERAIAEVLQARTATAASEAPTSRPDSS